MHPGPISPWHGSSTTPENTTKGNETDIQTNAKMYFDVWGSVWLFLACNDHVAVSGIFFTLIFRICSSRTGEAKTPNFCLGRGNEKTEGHEVVFSLIPKGDQTRVLIRDVIRNSREIWQSSLDEQSEN